MTSNHFVGGLVGDSNEVTSHSKISNSYSAGNVISDNADSIGGLVGYIGGNWANVCTDSFWDNETTGQAKDNCSMGSTGKTTAEMKTKSTFTDAGWDFTNIWAIDGFNDGYPYFRWEMPTINLNEPDNQHSFYENEIFTINITATDSSGIAN